VPDHPVDALSADLDDLPTLVLDTPVLEGLAVADVDLE